MVTDSVLVDLNDLGFDNRGLDLGYLKLDICYSLGLGLR